MGITKSDIRALILLGIIAVGWAASVAYYGMYLRSFKDGGDTWGYYIYLPSALISRDLHTLEYVKNKRATFAPHSIDPNLNPLGFGEVNFTENGRPIIKYTCGVALMMAPFFLIAHALAHLQGTPPDGFQPIYWIWMYIGNAMWVLLGLWVLRRALLRYVSDPIALVVLTLLAVGTNLYYFVVYSAPMSHTLLFSLYALLIYGSERFYDAPCTRYAAWIGLSAGLIVLIRPTEIIALFIPLIWRIDSLGERFRFWRNYGRILHWQGGALCLRWSRSWHIGRASPVNGAFTVSASRPQRPLAAGMATAGGWLPRPFLLNETASLTNGAGIGSTTNWATIPGICGAASLMYGARLGFLCGFRLHIGRAM